jgi:zinc D-Ala-D-Ala carboxypeptidase
VTPASNPTLKKGRISPNFTLQEMIKSQTATRLGIDNSPTEAHIEALGALCENVLEPTRANFAAPVVVSSGYRSAFLCEEIGSKPTSQHCKGEAVDFEVIGNDNYKVAKWIESNLDFDQLILEFYESGKPNSGWIHVSYKSDGQNRKQALTFNGRQYQNGLVK